MRQNLPTLKCFRLYDSSKRYQAKPVTSEGSWFFQILAKPPSQLVQLVGVRARDVLPLQCLRRGLKDCLFNMTVLVLAPNNKVAIRGPSSEPRDRAHEWRIVFGPTADSSLVIVLAT